MYSFFRFSQNGECKVAPCGSYKHLPAEALRENNLCRIIKLFGRLRKHNLRKRIFYKAMGKAKLRKIRIHDLRHTYATLRISKGDNILDVSKQLGHASVKITLDTYCHWVPRGKKSEVDELDFTKAPGTPAAVTDEVEVTE